MMENCCYDRIEFMTLNLVRKGLLGEVLHGEAGYLHDLRGVKFANEGEAARRPGRRSSTATSTRRLDWGPWPMPERQPGHASTSSSR